MAKVSDFLLEAAQAVSEAPYAQIGDAKAFGVRIGSRGTILYVVDRGDGRGEMKLTDDDDAEAVLRDILDRVDIVPGLSLKELALIETAIHGVGESIFDRTFGNIDPEYALTANAFAAAVATAVA